MIKYATRENIFAIFERHHAIPGATFDESHFMDFLMANPERKGAIRNSFTGLRRFNAFIDEIQYKYGGLLLCSRSGI